VLCKDIGIKNCCGFADQFATLTSLHSASLRAQSKLAHRLAKGQHVRPFSSARRCSFSLFRPNVDGQFVNDSFEKSTMFSIADRLLGKVTGGGDQQKRPPRGKRKGASSADQAAIQPPEEDAQSRTSWTAGERRGEIVRLVGNVARFPSCPGRQSPTWRTSWPASFQRGRGRACGASFTSLLSHPPAGSHCERAQ